MPKFAYFCLACPWASVRFVSLLTIWAITSSFLVVSTESFQNPFSSWLPRKLEKFNSENISEGEGEGEGETNENKIQDGDSIMKAWTSCHGRNQRDLVDRLFQAGIVREPAVRAVLEAIDRGNYTPKNPYMDAPQFIGLGQTISAPHMHATVLEEIFPYLAGKEELKLLDVGVGSGYLTAALGRWIKARGGEGSLILGNAVSGKVFGVDVHQGLIDLTTKNMQKSDSDLFEAGTVQVQLGDGWKGLPSEAPFDAIHVGAAADAMPHDLVAQLKVGGVMIIPIGPQNEVQYLYKIERTSQKDPIGFNSDDYQTTDLLCCRYVPLVHPDNLIN